MQKEQLLELLEKYRRHECTPQEVVQLEEWFDRLSQEGRWSGGDCSLEAIESSLKSQIDRRIVGSSRQKKIFESLRIAASVIIVLTVSFALWKWSGNLKDYLLPVKYRVTAVPAGRRVRIVFSDGSTMLLNSGSRVRYPEEFGSKKREVFLLEGEALFEVVHEADRPFIVTSGRVQTLVLGTVFNVSSYGEFKDVKVTVNRGKVAVGRNGSFGNPLILLPNDQAVYNKEAGVLRKTRVDSRETIGWKDGIFNFNNESLENIAFIMGNVYGIRMKFGDPMMGNTHIKACFTHQDSIDDILFSIAKVNGWNYQKNGKDVLFYMKNHEIKK